MAGGAATVITPAYVDVFAPGLRVPQIVGRNGGEQGVTATVSVRRNASLLVGDVLRVGADSRHLLVSQVVMRPADVFLLCKELAAPVPDEFENDAISAFWTTAGAGWTAEPKTGRLQLSLPNLTDPPDSFVYQTISNDFDVWAEIVVPVPSAGNTYLTYLAAVNPAFTEGVYAMILSGTTIYTRRSDETVGPGVVNGANAVEVKWVRLRRTGSAFHAYYALPLPYEPMGEGDWVGLVNAGAKFSLSGAVRLGLGGSKFSAFTPSAYFVFFRNWVGRN